MPWQFDGAAVRGLLNSAFFEPSQVASTVRNHVARLTIASRCSGFVHPLATPLYVAWTDTRGVMRENFRSWSPGEQVASPSDEFLDRLRGSAGDFLNRGSHAVIPILAV